MSIVLYVHNGDPYLDAAIDRILRQTHENFELCVVDDGSTDGTAELLAARAAADPRIRVQRQEARGRQRLHETVNAGLAMARHELIAMANADDLWSPSKLERQVAAFAADPDLDICTHDAVFIDDRGRVLHGGFRRFDSPYASAPPRPWQFIAGNPIPNPTTMFRRGILRRIGMQEVGDMHDHQFWFKATVHGCRFLGLPDRLIRYRLHEASHSTASARREIIEQTRRDCAVTMVERYGLDRIVPELALVDDLRSRAWAASFVASEFWSCQAFEAAEVYWRQAVRQADDPAILAGLGMSRLVAGDEVAALELIRAAAAGGNTAARHLSSSPHEVAQLGAPVWDGSEPPLAEIVRMTNRAGFELGTEPRPAPFAHVGVVESVDGSNSCEGSLTDWFLDLADEPADVRAQLLLTADIDLTAVQAAHVAATGRSPAVADVHVEVDVVPVGEQGSVVSAHELDGAAIRRIGARLAA